ncbi:hypothetical protein H6F89_23520 [Cyanobacteria bacterium FACHB-63]|nr:hypothetical protein [Cyanobacteria bacterium FACHB-63]
MHHISVTLVAKTSLHRCGLEDRCNEIRRTDTDGNGSDKASATIALIPENKNN